MKKKKEPSRAKIVFVDFLFSLAINVTYIIAAFLSSSGHRIGGAGDGNMIWVLFFLIWVSQIILSFFSLASFEIISNKPAKSVKSVIYPIANSIILFTILFYSNKAVFEGNKTIILYNLIVFISFILLYNKFGLTKYNSDLDESESTTINERIRKIFKGSNM